MAQRLDEGPLPIVPFVEQLRAIPLARTTLRCHSRSRMSHASRNPLASVGRIFMRSR